MARDDDLPDYLRGVEQQEGFGPERDNFTLRPDADGPMGRASFDKYADVDEEDDEEDDGKQFLGGAQGIATLFVGGLVLLVALVVLLGAVTAVGATFVRDAELATASSGSALVDVVVAERDIVRELGARGGDRTTLDAKLAAVDRATGLAKSMAALEYTHAVQNEIVAIGDVRGTPIQARQHALDRAQDDFESSLQDWRNSAGNPIGSLAVATGMASPAP
jgi:hypothetical protein